MKAAWNWPGFCWPMSTQRSSRWRRNRSLLEKTDEAVFGQLVDGDPQLRDAFEAVPGDEDWVTEWLSDRPSAPVAFGPYPPFMDPNPAVAIDGLVPNEDGSLTMGVY
jgi:hypothetical protein